jgi:hypothetical protein
MCKPNNCLLYGCGVANIGILCTEVSNTEFSCTCPGEPAVIVHVPDVFIGCIGSHPSDYDVVTHINALHIVAFLRNSILEITSVIFGESNGNSFTLTIRATVSLSSIEDLLKIQIARFLGGSYTAEDIILTYGSKRIEDGTVKVTVEGAASAAPINAHSLYMFGLLLMALHFF